MKVSTDSSKPSFKKFNLVIEVETREEKEAASRYMTENGWGHARCHDRNNGE